MSTDLQKREGAELALAEPQDFAGQLMQVVRENPTAGAENIRAMLDAAERMAKWQAEQAFNAAFARLKFPPFVKSAKGHAGKYAPLDDIQAVIDPILAAEGMTLTYSSGPANEKGEIPTFGILSHVGGHSRQGVIYLPPDVTPTRSGSTTMNALQSVGSATSYGMRYVAKLMLNLRFIGEDKDGAMKGDYITEKQAQSIEDIIFELAPDEEGRSRIRSKMLATFDAKVLADLHRANFQPAMNLLEAKRRGLGKDTK